MIKFFSLPIFSSGLFYFMLAHFALVVFLAAVNIKHLWREIKNIDKKIWLLLLLIFLAGFYLRNAEYWLGPHTDGYVAQESAHLWVLHGQHVKACALGNHQDCQIFEQVLAPPGYPLIIALAHLIFGIHSLNASIISAVLSSLAIILVFLIAYLVFKKEQISLYAALVYALIPLNIIYSQTGESRPAGLFFVGLAILFFLLALKNNKLITWLAAVASVSYAIYVRQESYILAPLLLVFWAVFKWPEIKTFLVDIFGVKKIDWRKILSAAFLATLFLALQLPVLRWLLLDNPYNTYQGNGWLGLHYKGIIIQGGALLAQFFNYSPAFNNFFHYNFIASILGIIGLLLIFIPLKKEKIFIAFWFLSYLVVYGLMFDGNIAGTGQLTTDYMRRSLMFHLPYALLAGYGFYRLTALIKKDFLTTSLILLGLSLVLFNYSFQTVNGSTTIKPSKENWRFYAVSSLFKDARAIKIGDRSLIYPETSYWQAISQTPNDCLVINSQYMVTTNDYFPDNQRRTAAIDLINEPNEKIVLEEFKKSRCLIYLEDYRCAANYRGSQDFGCIFLEKNLEKKFLFQRDNLKVYSAQVKQ